ncbi:MAG: multidrug efflux SMR transporter [Gammaproteobacteria bacterium]|nr:multidrug efflux SMR transporter [Gammaproteobacteria bacterium]
MLRTLVHATPSPLGAWLLILASGLLEIVFSALMKQSDGFTRPLPSLVAAVSALLSIWLMTISLRTLPLAIAYAVWAGIGTLGTALAAVLLFGEEFTLPKAAFMGVIVVGIVGLQLQSAE